MDKSSEQPACRAGNIFGNNAVGMADNLASHFNGWKKGMSSSHKCRRHDRYQEFRIEKPRKAI
jgi:hypothetical protein